MVQVRISTQPTRHVSSHVVDSVMFSRKILIEAIKLETEYPFCKFLKHKATPQIYLKLKSKTKMETKHEIGRLVTTPKFSPEYLSNRRETSNNKMSNPKSLITKSHRSKLPIPDFQQLHKTEDQDI